MSGNNKNSPEQTSPIQETSIDGNYPTLLLKKNPKGQFYMSLDSKRISWFLSPEHAEELSNEVKDVLWKIENECRWNLRQLAIDCEVGGISTGLFSNDAYVTDKNGFSTSLDFSKVHGLLKTWKNYDLSFQQEYAQVFNQLVDQRIKSEAAQNLASKRKSTMFYAGTSSAE